MRIQIVLIIFAICTLWFTFTANVACSQSTPARGMGGGLDNTDLSMFQPIKTVLIPHSGKDKALWDLGKKLFNETKLSLNDDISCNSCHKLEQYGVDHLPTSPGHLGQIGERNSPSVFNSFLHLAQFWDGRASDLEDQALQPITNPIEMAMPNIEAVVSLLKLEQDYVTAFVESFPNEKNPISGKNIARALGYFEKTLATPSRFDRYLEGDKNALSQQEKRGLKMFVHSGCASCHNGIGVGGNSYQKLGVVVPYPTNDVGRYNVTHDLNDKFVFKVPSLRNIVKTAPYLHDGSIADLKEMIRLMGQHQLGRNFPNHYLEDVAAFLESLTGEIPQEVL